MPLSARLSIPLLLGLVCAAPPSMAAKPGKSALTEETSARLVVERLRVTPNRWAHLGECRQIAPDDLRVSLRGQEVATEGVDLDRRVRPTLHALAIDTSGSMTQDLPYAKYAAAEYIRQLRPGKERAFVVTFDENVVLQQAVTDNRDALIDAIDHVRIGARTAMLDAMYYAMRELDAHRERPVLVLLTDGADIASFYSLDDLARLVIARPDLTVFTIGVGLRTAAGTRPTRELLGQVSAATNGEFFDVGEGASLNKVFGTIRDILENEAVISVVDPKPEKKPGKLVVESLNKNCKVKLLTKAKHVEGTPQWKPIPRPYGNPPQSYSSYLTPGHRKLYVAAADRFVDEACGSGGYFRRMYGGEPLDPLWFFHVGQRSVSGCGLDVMMEYGLLYDPAAKGMATHNNDIKVRARPFEMTLPSFDDLPQRPEEAMDSLGQFALTADPEVDTDPTRRPVDRHARPFYDYPGLAHGMSFMEMRPVLSRAAFLYPEYRAWVMDKLQQSAEEELSYLEEGYRRRFPELADAKLAAAARQSKDGQEILHRAENPSELDLQQYLAAWLGDITAHELFCRWELERINDALAGRRPRLSDSRFVEAWDALYRVFFVPSYARSLTLLQPTYDSDRDRVGYWRVVLPRTSWMTPRILNSDGHDNFANRDLDLVAQHPFGAWLMGHLAEREPLLSKYLSERGFRAAVLEYNVLGLPETLLPESAYQSTRVHLVLALGEPGRAGAPTLEVTADVKLRPSGPTMDELALTAANDPALEELAVHARAAGGASDETGELTNSDDASAPGEPSVP